MSDFETAKRGGSLESLIRSGDAERIARVLRPSIRRIAGHILAGRDPELIETAANDALLAVCRHGSGFRGQAKASTWVYTITRRAALRCARRESAYRARFLDWSDGTDRDSSDEFDREERGVNRARPSHPLTAREALQTLEEAVPNPAWRRLWLMWNVSDVKRSRAEIASINGYAVGSVDVILSLVRARIRAALARGSDGV